MLAAVATLLAFWLARDRETWIGIVLACAIGAMLLRFLLVGQENRGIRVQLDDAIAERERLAVTDPLTGLPNRAAVVNALRQRGPSPGVLVLELDDPSPSFDERDDDDRRGRRAPVRARRGRHRAGALGRFGVRPARPRHELQAITATAERLRVAIAGEPFATGALGACVGVAWAPGEPGHDVLRRAQKARDQASQLGGNQVRTDGEPGGIALLESVADAVDVRRHHAGHSRTVAPVGGRRGRSVSGSTPTSAGAVCSAPACTTSPWWRRRRLSCGARTRPASTAIRGSSTIRSRAFR